MIQFKSKSKNQHISRRRNMLIFQKRISSVPDTPFFVFKEKCQKMGLRDKKSSENDDSLESILFKYGNKGILSGVLLPLNIEFECIFDLEPGNRYSI